MAQGAGAQVATMEGRGRAINGVVDVGAESGASTARLSDSGYLVVPIDMDSYSWGPSGIRLTIADLSQGDTWSSIHDVIPPALLR